VSLHARRSRRRHQHRAHHHAGSRRRLGESARELPTTL